MIPRSRTYRWICIRRAQKYLVSQIVGPMHRQLSAKLAIYSRPLPICSAAPANEWYSPECLSVFRLAAAAGPCDPWPRTVAAASPISPAAFVVKCSAIVCPVDGLHLINSKLRENWADKNSHLCSNQRSQPALETMKSNCECQFRWVHTISIHWIWWKFDLSAKTKLSLEMYFPNVKWTAKSISYP